MSKLSIEHALAARAALIEPGADPLDPEVEQRLLALLVERALPLLLRCLQKWYSGARLVAHILCIARSPALLIPRTKGKHVFQAQASPACALADITCAPFCPGMPLMGQHLFVRVPAAM